MFARAKAQTILNKLFGFLFGFFVKSLRFFFFSFPPKKMSLPLPPNEEGNELRDVFDDDDLSEDGDAMMMKTMDVRAAANRRKEGGNATTTDDVIDFDRTLALGKLLEIY